MPTRRAQPGRAPSGRAARRAAPVRVEAPPAGTPAPALYGVALLRVALELKRHPGRSLEEALAPVLARMRIPPADFQRFLAGRADLTRALGAAFRRR